MALTPKKRLFAREYLRDLNATQAAIRAGYSKASAHAQGHDLLKEPEVDDLVETLRAQREMRVDVKVDDVLRELIALASLDVSEAFDEHGALLPIHEIPLDVRKAIAGFEVEEISAGGGEERAVIGTLRKVKFVSKEKALELLGRHLKMFTDKFEVKVDGSFAELLKKARERAQRR